MRRCTTSCLLFTLLVLVVVTFGHDEDEQTFNEGLRTLQLFSRFRQAAAERRSFQEEPEEKRKLEKYCNAEGVDCKPPFKLCCGELECYWPDGWSLRNNGVCVDCLLENRTCQRDEQCCESMHCEKDSTINIDGACVRPGPPAKGNTPSTDRCVGMGQKCRRDSQCCQNQKHHLQCNKTYLFSIDGTCEKYRRIGGCYRDGQCVNDCEKAWYQVYGQCV